MIAISPLKSQVRWDMLCLKSDLGRKYLQKASDKGLIQNILELNNKE